MPYITAPKRLKLAKGASPTDPGELNYLITRLLIDYCENCGLKYQIINDCVGALECAKLEFQRRVIDQYECKKIRENGDVYPTDEIEIPTKAK